MGSQTAIGDKIVEQGDKITPATAAMIAGLGIVKITVFQKPRITIINTGKELTKPGGTLSGSQIFESNSYALHAALKELHLDVEEICWVDDKIEDLQLTIKNSLASSDVILLTGGVSVGDYDIVIPCLQQNGVEQLFHKVKQKPGKPLFFGKKENKIVFGLPGNPASVLTCFYMYVLPSLRKILGYSNCELLQLRLPLLDVYAKKTGLVHFLQANVSSEGVSLFHNQQSYKMNSFAKANAIVEIPEECTEVKKDGLVKVYLLFT
jgi:molybdopterin molybdotransferase